MEPTDRKRLNRFGARTFLSLLILMLGFWLYPIWLKSNPSKPPEVVTKEPVLPHPDINRMVASLLVDLELNEPLASQNENELISAIYLSESPINIADQLQKKLKEINIESYTLNIDGVDAEIRIYNGPNLTHRLLLTPKIDISTTNQKTEASLHERPLVSIIISGLGNRDLLKISRFTLPLTLAIKPYQPFSLRIAQDAGIHHQEILFDLRHEGSKIFNSFSSIPYASGLLTAKQYPNDLIPHFYTNAFPSDGVISDQPFILPTQTKGKHSVGKLLARSLRIAKQQGYVAIMIDSSDDEIDIILDWMSRAKELGYRLVFASEASRQVDVKGPMQ